MNAAEQNKVDASSAASVSLNSGNDETGEAKGVYTIAHTGPVERLRARYVELRDRIAAVASGTERMAKVVLADMKAELEAIPFEEKSAPEVFPNTVVTVGKNYLLDNGMAGSSFTAAFYMGLIDLTSYSAISAADTMASHAGWLEAGGTNAPAYSQGTRPACAWSAASAGAKALSAALTFSITSAGTVKGCFLTTVSTKDGTTGTLFSAGLFTGGDKLLANADTLNCSYSVSV